MEATGGNGNSVDYIAHIQKLFEEYEQLQLEHARLLQHFAEQQVVTTTKSDVYFSNENNNKTNDELRIELENEKTQNKSLKTEINYLLNQVSNSQKRYNDLLNIAKDRIERTVGSEMNCERKLQLNLRISQLENENRDLKENIEFVTSENAVLTDSVKDLEETIFKERMEWLNEKEKYEEVVSWSRDIYEKTKTDKSKMEDIEKQIENFDNFLIFVQNFAKSVSLCDAEDENKLQNCDLKEKLLWCQDVIQKCLSKQLNNGADINKNILNSSTDEESQLNAHKIQLQQDSFNANNKCLVSENAELKNLTDDNKNIDSDQIDLKLEIANLTTKLADMQETNEKLGQKYARNRKVWEDNESKLSAEIDRLDNFISLMFETLQKLPENLKKSPELQQLITIIDQNELDKSGPK